MSDATIAGAQAEVIGATGDAALPALPDPRFDSIAALARRILGVPGALVTIIVGNEHRIPGSAADDAMWEQTRELPMSYSICRLVVADRAPLVLSDTRTERRLEGNRSVTELGVLAYAGLPLTSLDGMTVGALCVTDDHPREWTDDELGLMGDLAAICSSELQLRQAAARAAVAADRDRIAREFTAGITSELLSLSMVLGGLRSLTRGEAADTSQRAMDTVDHVLATIRSSIFDSRARRGE